MINRNHHIKPIDGSIIAVNVQVAWCLDSVCGRCGHGENKHRNWAR